MADSASFGFSAQITKNGESISDSHSVSYTPASIFKAVGKAETVTNSWVAIPFGSATTIRRFWVKNFDAAISIDIAIDNAGAKIFATIPPLESMFPHPVKSGATYYWKTSASTCSASVGFDGAS